MALASTGTFRYTSREKVYQELFLHQIAAAEQQTPQHFANWCKSRYFLKKKANTCLNKQRMTLPNFLRQIKPHIIEDLMTDHFVTLKRQYFSPVWQNMNYMVFNTCF